MSLATEALLQLDLRRGLDCVVGDDPRERPDPGRVVLLGLAGRGPGIRMVSPTAVLAGLICAIPTRFSSGIEIALAPELSSPM